MVMNKKNTYHFMTSVQFQDTNRNTMLFVPPLYFWLW